MKDMMMNIYTALKANPVIAEKIKDRITFYQADESFDTSKAFIIIDVLTPQQAAYFASNKELSTKFSYQINVETYNPQDTKAVAQAIKHVMRELKFGQLPGGLDTYFEETKRFVDARRYRKNTNIHDTDY